MTSELPGALVKAVDFLQEADALTVEDCEPSLPLEALVCPPSLEMVETSWPVTFRCLEEEINKWAFKNS